MPPIIVHPIRLQPHPANARLRIGHVGSHQVVVGDHYFEGQLGFYIPEGVIVPDKLAEEMWVLGRLAGAKHNRVKARLMSGVLSEGLFYGSQGASWNPAWREGDNVASEVGITDS